MMGLKRRVNQCIQARTVFLLKQVIYRGGSVHLQKRGRFGHIQNAFARLDPKPEFAIALYGQQGKPTRHSARSSGLRIRFNGFRS